jgi:hypothetical protein
MVDPLKAPAWMNAHLAHPDYSRRNSFVLNVLRGLFRWKAPHYENRVTLVLPQDPAQTCVNPVLTALSKRKMSLVRAVLMEAFNLVR